jgi:ABC-2 type transport system ATP-binding protein
MVLVSKRLSLARASLARKVSSPHLHNSSIPALVVNELSRLRNGYPVVRSVSFSIGKGEVVGLLGANGAGKTTTLRMIAQVLRQSDGEVLIAGFNPKSQKEHAMKSLGYLPQQPPLYDDLTVREQLLFVAELMGLKRQERRVAMERVVELCDLSGVTQMLCGHLSTGFRKRVGIAGSLVHSPSVVLLDEPFTGLDPLQRIALRTTLTTLGKHHAILLSTHLLSEVSQFCTRALIMAGGVLQADLALDSELAGFELEQTFFSVLNGGQPNIDHTSFGQRSGDTSEMENSKMPNRMVGNQ